MAVSAGEASTGIEPVWSTFREFAQHFTFDSEELRGKVDLYADHFEKAGE